MALASEFKVELVCMLVQFDQFCRSQGLAYSLSCGTLLGAVRHQGFIPWDDDLDVMMPRPDYDALVSLADDFRKATGLRVAPYQDLPPTCSPIAKVVDDRIAVHAAQEERESSLWIDIFPVDGLPTSDKLVIGIYRKSDRLRSLLYLLYSVRRGSTPLKTAIKTILQPMKRIGPLKVAIAKELDDLARSIPYGGTPYVGNVAWGTYGPGERMPYEGFNRLVRVSFEGHEFNAMSCWDEYLTGIYGDYMQLPPEGKRVSHGIEAWWRDGQPSIPDCREEGKEDQQ